MNLIPKRISLIFVLFISLFSMNLFAQNANIVLTLSKYSNQKKVRQIDPVSYFKVKTNASKKLKGKFSSISDNYFVSTENDTIYLNEINWIKAKRKLKKWEKAIAIPSVFAGTFFSFGTIPAAFMIMSMESTPLIFLVPIATVSIAIYGFVTLGGRRYKMKRWKLDTQKILN